MAWSTADLCDAFGEQLQWAEPLFRAYGGQAAFHGPVSTVKAFEDNSLVRAALQEEGHRRVLVVDGGGSSRRAMLGDRLAALAHAHGWAGIVIYGAVRDTAILRTIDLGILALNACPLRSEKRNEGQRDLILRFAGVSVVPNSYVYADDDGLIIAPRALV